MKADYQKKTKAFISGRIAKKIKNHIQNGGWVNTSFILTKDDGTPKKISVNDELEFEICVYHESFVEKVNSIVGEDLKWI